MTSFSGVLSGSSPDASTLQKAARWCKKEFASRWDGRSHPSFLVGELLEEADKKFNLNSFGVEGWSSPESAGRSGVQYLNYGDSYASTVVSRTWPHRVTFSYAAGGWASYA